MNSAIITQRTSKTLKAQLILSAWLFWFGLLTFLFSGKLYVWTVLIGGVWYVITKLLVWWQHK